jgi:formylmethanofuran dehydrogenase subunit C
VSVALRLRKRPPARVDASPLTPERCNALNRERIAGLPLRCGRETVAVGDLFEVDGYVSDWSLTIAGDLRDVDGIGAGMRRGALTVHGDCGDRAGAGMRGGELTIDGGAGSWAGAEMAGGLLRISGDAGPRLGAAAVGARAGMHGGEIVVGGDAGEEAGAGMRRGLVLIGARAGAGAGLRMLAGTVIALGGLGPEAGIANKRGTLASGRALGARPLPGYARASRLRPPALRLQLLRARALGVPVDDAVIDGSWTRWSGDFTELGRGELLIFEDDRGANG